MVNRYNIPGPNFDPDEAGERQPSPPSPTTNQQLNEEQRQLQQEEEKLKEIDYYYRHTKQGSRLEKKEL